MEYSNMILLYIKEILYIHVDRYSKYRAVGIHKIPHTTQEQSFCPPTYTSQAILHPLISISLKTYSMNKGQPYLTTLSNLHLKDNPTDFFLFLPFLGGGNREHLNVSSPPPIYARGGWGRWLAGSFLVLRPCQRTGGDGGEGQPLHMTTYLTSQAQQSLNFTSLMITAFQIVVTDSPLILFPFR
jgi:hypothetical protein